MRFSFSIAALIGTCLLAGPAQAAPVSAIKVFVLPAQFGDSAPVIKVQRMMVDPAQPPLSVAPRAGGSPRAGGQHHGAGRQHHGGGGQRHHGGHRGHGGDDGGAVAAGVFGGLLLGAIIANEAQRGNDCRRYRSYDRRSRTFIAGDGRRYRCP